MEANARPLLSWLADKGPLREVRKRLESGDDVDSTDSKQRTALSYAAEHRKRSIAKLLLDHGATVDSRDIMGRTPLSYAAESDCPRIVQLVLFYNADINSQCKDGRTPLSYAAGQGCPGAMDTLLRKGADLTIRDYEGGSARLCGHFLALKNREEVVAKLTQQLFHNSHRQPVASRLPLTELEAKVLNEDWTLKNDWDWIDDGGKPLFFQSYEAEITTEELGKSRMEKFSETGPWGKWMGWS